MLQTKRLDFVILATLAFAGCQDAGQKDDKTANVKAETKLYTIEQFMDNESVAGGRFSKDNSKLIVSSNKTGIYNVYTVPVTGGEMTAITASDTNSYFATSFFPEDDRILLGADNNGDENSHIYVRELDGSLKDLTPVDGSNSDFYGWTEDNKSLYFRSNMRNPRFFDVYKMSLSDYSYEMLYQNDSGFNLALISKDESKFVLTKSITTSSNDMFLYDVNSGETRKLNEAMSKNSPQDFSPNDSVVFYTTDADGEFAYLMSYNVSSGEKKKVMEKDWDIVGCSFTKKGNYFVVYVNEDGMNVIEVLDAATMAPVDQPDFGNRSITRVRFSADESWMSMRVGGSNTPSDLYTYNIESKEKYQITSVLNKEIDIKDMVMAKVVRYKSFDGTEIPAIYYLPHAASESSRVPALVWVHGGPGGQSTQHYRPLFQYLVNHGYAILAVNNRGSSGYGKTFSQMDDLNHGEKDLQDCIEGKNWLATQSAINSEKIGIIGGSYGGYMTMAALTYAPEEFNVGVNIFGVTNWLRTLKSIPPYWESFREAMYKEVGDPFSDDSVRLRKMSPLFHTENVVKPLMVLQGAKDPRVLQVESDEIVENVRKNGVEVEYVLFEDEGHGFLKTENKIEAYGKILKFLDKNLKQIPSRL